MIFKIFPDSAYSIPPSKFLLIFFPLIFPKMICLLHIPLYYTLFGSGKKAYSDSRYSQVSISGVHIARNLTKKEDNRQTIAFLSRME